MRCALRALPAVLASVALCGVGCSHDWDPFDPRLDDGAGGASASGPGSGGSPAAGGGPGSGAGPSASATGSGGSGASGGGSAGGAGGGGCVPPGVVGYAAEVLADCPASYWRLGGTNASDGVVDEIGAVDGVYEDAPLLGEAGAIARDADTAVALDGLDDGFGFGDVYDQVGAASFTIEVWVKPTAHGLAYPRVFSKEVYGPSRNGYTMFLREPDAADLNQTRHGFECWTDGEVTIRVMPPQAPPLDVWTHVVARMDGPAKEMTVFHDGVIVGTETGSDCALVDNAGALRFGDDGSTDPDGRYTGGLDEVAVYDFALGDERILAHYQAGAGR